MKKAILFFLLFAFTYQVMADEEWHEGISHQFCDYISCNHDDSSVSSESFIFSHAKGMTLSFDWCVSSEIGCDILRIILDDQEIVVASGEDSGTFSCDITDNDIHTLTCSYEKDVSISVGEDRAVVSRIFLEGVMDIIHITVPYQGGVSSILSEYDLQSIRSLKITGPIDNRDIFYLKELSITGTLEYLDIRDADIKILKDYAFQESCLKTILLPLSLEEIGDYAFSNCNEMINIYIPDNVTTIHDNPFSSCDKLTTINVGESNQKFTSVDGILLSKDGYSLIACPAGKTNINIPQGVKKICSSAIQGSKVTSLYLPEGVEQLENHSINSCYYLQKVHLPSTLKEISRKFVFCVNFSLKEIEIEESNPYFKVIDNIIYTKDLKTLICCPAGKAGKVFVPDGVEIVDTGAFAVTPYIEEVLVPEGLKKINWYAFVDCYATMIDLPSTLEQVSYTCFGKTNFVYEYINNEDTSPRLKTLIVRSLIPPIAVNSLFDKGDKETNYTNLVVPFESIPLYRNDIAWGKIKKILALENVIDIVDSSDKFYNDTEFKTDFINYSRTFNNTKWQALYIPFSMNYENWADEFDIARINDVHQYDDDDNGSVDRTELEVIKVKSGSIDANTPYLIRAKEEGEKTITVENATLYKTDVNTFNVSSWNTMFTFKGTYSEIPGTEMFGKGYYALGGGRLIQAESEDNSLGAFRWYMSVTNRDGNSKNDINEVKIRVLGDDWDEDETGVVSVEAPVCDNDETIFDMSGREVKENGLKRGIYVKNGHKFMVK